MSELQEKQALPPYVPYKTFLNFINGLREQGLPQHITRDVYPGSNSGKAAMGAAFRSLKLINGDDTPTQRLRQIIESEKNYTGAMNVILGQTYDFIDDPSIDLATTTGAKLEDRFRKMGASGSTVSKCMQFFLLAAKDSGIEISSYVKAPVPERSAKKTKKRTPNENTSRQGGTAHGMTKITVPLHGMPDWTIQFPDQMTDQQWDQGLKMTSLILENYRSAMVEEDDEGDDEQEFDDR